MLTSHRLFLALASSRTALVALGVLLRRTLDFEVLARQPRLGSSVAAQYLGPHADD